MGVEVKPLGVACNIQCQYCYQNELRDSSDAPTYDLEKIKSAVAEEGRPFSLFGGEPLLMPLGDLEDLFRWGWERFGVNHIQTNGTLITDEHIRVFKAYNVRVGISIDGPGELNDLRWHHSEANTRNSTAAVEACIEKLCAVGLCPALIATLHRGNVRSDRLPQFLDWVRYLDSIGVSSLRLHLLEVDSRDVEVRFGLSVEETRNALMALMKMEGRLSRMRFDLFSDIRRLLQGADKQTTCVWNACDPWTTAAVRGIEGDGTRTNCGRTNKEGVEFQKSDRESFERYVILGRTPQVYGGCQGCRFFIMCKGQCPGTSIDGDWRNRSSHCEAYKAMFEAAEVGLRATGRTPLSLHPARGGIERMMLSAWERGENISIAVALERLQSTGARRDDGRR